MTQYNRVILAAEPADVPVYSEGVTVYKDAESPSGYTVHFLYDSKEEREQIAKVEVSGPFNYTDGEKSYAPDEYRPGMYASNFHPETKDPASPFGGEWGRKIEMHDGNHDGIFEAEFPITSGTFGYTYVITYVNGETKTIADPANLPDPALMNAKGNHLTGDLNVSIVKGVYDEEKQAGSPNMDYVLDAEKKGTVSYVSYTDINGDEEYLGVYLPYGYDPERAKPYKTLYLSHGGGGDETDWFHMGSANSIMDNFIAQGITPETVIVTMDNSHYEWKFKQIVPNIAERVVPFIEAHYNVSREAKNRAMCGLSMGGQTTTNVFWKYPRLFGYLGIFSGTNADTQRLMLPAYNDPKVMTIVGTTDFASKKFAGDGADMFAAYSGEGGHFTIETLAAWCESNIADTYANPGDIYVNGSHDWFTWPQALARFLKEVAWTKKKEQKLIFVDPKKGLDDIELMDAPEEEAEETPETKEKKSCEAMVGVLSIVACVAAIAGAALVTASFLALKDKNKA